MLEKTQPPEIAPLVVACCFDENMLVGARLLLSSIMEAHQDNTRRIVFHVVSSVPVAGKDMHAGMLPPNITLHVHEAPKSPFEDVRSGPWLTPATFMRLGLADLLDDERVLYLDCDTLVRRDLSALFDVDLADALLAAVPDSILTRNHSDFRVTYGDMELLPHTYVQQVCGVADVADYFNAGVMLLNLRQWRIEKTASALATLIAQRQSLYFADQDALNAVVQRRYVKLDPRWNAISYGLFPEPPDSGDDPEWARILTAWRTDPWIIHFVGFSKPWLANARKTIFHAEACRHLSSSFQHPSPDAGKPRPALPPPPVVGLPLVSVIVVNHNYGSYLRKCVSSILLQDYPNIECIIIDNASSDGSGEVIDALQAEFRGLKVVRRAENAGQGAAWQEGYERTSGKYVMFVDADDFLLQGAIAHHVCTHLRLPQSTGFTSTDMIQVEDEQVVLGTYFEAAFRRHPREATVIKASDLKALDHAVQAGKRFPLLASGDTARLLRVRHSSRSWVWSPTSANMYRRDALSLFIRIPSLASFVSNADTFINVAVNAFVGSVLIDKPLSAYRLHGRNSFSKGPSLHNFANYAKANDAASRSALLVAEYVIDNLEDFETRCLSPFVLFSALRTLRKRAADHPGKWQSLRALYVAANQWALDRTLRALRRELARVGGAKLPKR